MLEQSAEEAAVVPVIGVGASAGGIEAFEGFFRGMPDDPGLAIVIVTHLNPERESILHEIVARYTALSVKIATDEVQVAANCVYVMPSDCVLTISGGRLNVVKGTALRRERKPVDVFLSSLALDLGEYAGGVILSGGDGDGTLGIKAIKERGGITLAQVKNGHGPAHSSMPDSAIATGYIDFAVPAEKMGEKLVGFVHGLAALALPGEKATEQTTLEQARSDICFILRSQVGHDFAGYKVRTFLRRVQRRMQVAQLDTIDAYVEMLRQDPAEAVALFRDLLINVTNFFRDAEAFQILAQLVIPRLFERRAVDGVIRIWVPGCATGEEVYSIAMLMLEHMDPLETAPRVQIFATDIDDHALAVARTGRFPAALLDSVSPERRQRFFVADGVSFVVSKEVRELCIFSPHSVIRDPPFSRMDLVSCRNLLIYFGPDVQGQVVPTFHYALRPGGFLFLGTSENIAQYRDLFAPVDQKQRIFRKREDGGPTVRLPMMVRGLQSPGYLPDARARRASGTVALRQSVQAQVLERFSPPHVVVNREGDVVYFSSRTGKYLEQPPGQPTRQLLTMLRKGLRLDMRTLFREALENSGSVNRPGVAVEDDDGRVQFVTLAIEPIEADQDEPLFLILFTDEGPTLSREEAANRTLFLHDGQSIHLEQELRDTRERLQSLVEEYETALEELKSSNEELQSVNEEFQSTNEELEASKEELQSLNEELQTVNAELTRKIDSLDRANSDLQNLFDSTNVATVFLDRSLLIRSFTPAVSRVLHMLPGDRGRPITDLSGMMQLPWLADDVASVVAGTDLVERQIELGDTVLFLVRITPYRDAEHAIMGAVVTFVDVTTLRKAEARLRVLVAELQHRTRNLLGVVQAIARRTIGRGAPFDAFLDRLMALGRVQGLISEATNGTTGLEELVHLEVTALGATVGEGITITGPPVALRLDDVQPVAMVLHELTTNAVKHGALTEHAAQSGAKLAIEWTVQGPPGEQTLVVDWIETGVARPSRLTPPNAFGLQLIERSMVAAMQARTQITFGDDGVHCHIEIPLAHAGDAAIAPARVPAM